VNAALKNEIAAELQKELAKESARQEAEFAAKEKAVKEREQKLLAKQQAFEAELEQKLETEKKRLWAIAQEKAKEKLDVEFADMKKTLAEKDARIEEARQMELKFREQKRQLEEAQKNLEVEMARRLDRERLKIEEKMRDELGEESRKKLIEKEQQLEQMRKTIEDLKRKSEQGSMQVQGDAQEEDLKRLLTEAFPNDRIEDVPTGIRGADLVQYVKDAFGRDSGIILWESKNTKAWGGDWIKKLKEDQSLIKADIAIIASRMLPDDLKHFGWKEGVCVVDYKYAVAMASVLRIQLAELHKTRQSAVGKNEKMEYLYNYLAGNDFRTRMENIVLAFTSMQADLESEKRSMLRIWKKREMEIRRVVTSTAGLYGDLQGIIGASLQTIESLELPAAMDEELLDAADEMGVSDRTLF
jgi:hypothetical protein